MEKVTIGADPEVFLTKDGKPYPVFGLIGGTKYSPLDMGNGIKLQEDNVMAEYNIPPCNNEEEFIHFNLLGLQSIKDIMPDDIDVDISETATFDPKYLDNEAAKTFGCDPDINAYTRKRNFATTITEPIRVAGGHIHVGIELENRRSIFDIVKIFDLTFIPLFLKDSDPRRRKFYGKAGSFRLKDYGFEYRTPSSKWLLTKSNIALAYHCVIDGLNLWKEGFLVSDKMGEELSEAINILNKSKLFKLRKEYA